MPETANTTDDPQTHTDSTAEDTAAPEGQASPDAQQPESESPDQAETEGQSASDQQAKPAKKKKRKKPADAPKKAKDAPPPDETLLARVEAILLSNAKPVAAAKIVEVVNALASTNASPEAGDAPVPAETGTIDAAVDLLNKTYDETGRAFRIESVAGGYRVMTRPEHADVLAAFHRKQASGRLSRPAIETLAIIAYKQPMTRAKLEAIRGVGCGEVLRSLLERRMIAVTGRAEELGRPMLYGTTKQFLDAFGIRSVKDLPSVESMLTAQGDPA